MAKVTYIQPIANISGRLNKKERSGSVQRQKHYRDEHGKVIATGVQESFCYRNPRDYTKNPPKGEEAHNISLFAQAVSIAKAERANPERLAYWTERWHNQLEKGEPEAPINPQTGEHRIYRRLDIFIQTAIQRALQSGTWKQ